MTMNKKNHFMLEVLATFELKSIINIYENRDGSIIIPISISIGKSISLLEFAYQSLPNSFQN